MLVGGHFALLHPGVFRQGDFGVEAIALPGLRLFLSEEDRASQMHPAQRSTRTG